MQSKTPKNEDQVKNNDDNLNDENLEDLATDQKYESQEPEDSSNEPSNDDKINELNSKYLYAMAELDNTRKRHIKERSDLMKYSGEVLARDLLEVLDDLERAGSQPVDSESSQVLEGVNLIANRMRTLFERYGIKAEDSNGKMFDPKKHEALTMAPSSPEDAGKILQQVTKCYFYKDKLLRPGQVIVGSGESLENAGSLNEKA